MLRFPIHWEIQYSYSPSGFVCEGISELKLNDEWKITCNWKGNNRYETKVKCFKICRKFTSEEMLVSGTLSFQSARQRGTTKEFSKLIERGSSFMTIDLRDPFDFFWRSDECNSHSSSDTLSGTVYITSSREKCTSDSVIGECSEKCTHVKTLLKLLNDFERLLDPKSTCYVDVNLKCGKTSIPAHKNILSTRSPVFATMFANEMKENRENQINITDMDASVVRAMLIYIYTGKTSSLTVPSAADLLFAADKYQLEDLKRLCCDFLKEAVSPQNVVRILVLGDLHAEDLKSFAIDYICNKCADFSIVENSVEWKTLRKQRADLAMDVMISLVKSRDGKGVHASKSGL